MSIDSKFDSEDIRIAPRRYSLGTRVAAALSTAMLAATLMFSGCKDPRDLDKGDNSYQHDLPTMNVPVDPARVYGTGADAGADGDADADSDSLRITPTMNLPVDAGRADAETAYDSNADAGRDADSEPLPGGLTDTRVSDIPLSAPAEPETEAEETYDPNHGMDEDVYADFQDLFAEDYSLLVPDPEQYSESSSTAASGTDDDLTLTAAENFTEDTAATTEPSATADDAVSGTATGPTATADPDTAPAPTAATSSPAADTGCNADLYSRIVAAVRAVNPVSHNPSYNLEGDAISNQDVVNTAYSHSIEGRTVRPYEGNWRGAQRWLDSITGGLVKIWDLTGSRDGENRRGYEFTLSTLPGCADDTPAEDAGTPAPTAPRRTSGGTGGHGHGGHSHGSHGGGSHAHAPSHSHAPSHAPAHAGPPNMETAPDGHTIITTPSGGIVHYGTYGESTIPDLTPGMHEAGTIGVLPDGSTVDLGATAALPAREEQSPAVEESAPAVEDAAPAAVPDAAPELVPETAPTAPEVIPDLVPPTPASDDNPELQTYMASSVHSLTNFVNSVQNDADSLFAFGQTMHEECQNGSGHTLCDIAEAENYENRCGEANDPRVASGEGYVPVCGEAAFRTLAGLIGLTADFDSISERYDALIHDINSAGVSPEDVPGMDELNSSINHLEDTIGRPITQSGDTIAFNSYAPQDEDYISVLRDYVSADAAYHGDAHYA